MGGTTVGTWKIAGLNINNAPMQNGITHPCNTALTLHFIEDVPHLLKCMRNCLETQDIALQDAMLHARDLSYKIVSMGHVLSLHKFQENKKFQVAQGLTKTIINTGQCLKCVYCQKMDTGLKNLLVMGDINDTDEEVEATRWLVNNVGAWLEIMTNRRRFKSSLF